MPKGHVALRPFDPALRGIERSGSVGHALASGCINEGLLGRALFCGTLVCWSLIIQHLHIPWREMVSFQAAVQRTVLGLLAWNVGLLSGRQATWKGQGQGEGGSANIPAYDAQRAPENPPASHGQASHKRRSGRQLSAGAAACSEPGTQGRARVKKVGPRETGMPEPVVWLGSRATQDLCLREEQAQCHLDGELREALKQQEEARGHVRHVGLGTQEMDIKQEEPSMDEHFNATGCSVAACSSTPMRPTAAAPRTPQLHVSTPCQYRGSGDRSQHKAAGSRLQPFPPPMTMAQEVLLNRPAH